MTYSSTTGGIDEIVDGTGGPATAYSAE
jgi:hypothetical protein